MNDGIRRGAFQRAGYCSLANSSPRGTAVCFERSGCGKVDTCLLECRDGSSGCHRRVSLVGRESPPFLWRVLPLRVVSSLGRSCLEMVVCRSVREQVCLFRLPLENVAVLYTSLLKAGYLPQDVIQSIMLLCLLSFRKGRESVRSATRTQGRIRLCGLRKQSHGCACDGLHLACTLSRCKQTEEKTRITPWTQDVIPVRAENNSRRSFVRGVLYAYAIGNAASREDKEKRLPSLSFFLAPALPLLRQPHTRHRLPGWDQLCFRHVTCVMTFIARELDPTPMHREAMRPQPRSFSDNLPHELLVKPQRIAPHP